MKSVLQHTGPQKKLRIEPPEVVPDAYIYFDSAAFFQARYLTDECPHGEVQWFHRVEREEQDGNYYYRIFDMFIPEQEVTAATVDTSPELMAKLVDEIDDLYTDEDGQIDDEAVDIVLASMTVWAHSHVKMPCRPSGTDEEQIATRIALAEQTEAPNPQIMFIMNQKGEYYVRITDIELGFCWENVPIQLYHNNPDMEYVQTALDTKIELARPMQGKKAGQSVNPTQGTPNSNRGSQTTTTTTTGGSSATTDASNVLALGDLTLVRTHVNDILEWSHAINAHSNSSAVQKFADLLKSLNNNADNIWLWATIFLTEDPIEWSTSISIGKESAHTQASFAHHLDEMTFEDISLVPYLAEMALACCWTKTRKEALSVSSQFKRLIAIKSQTNPSTPAEA